MVVHSYAQACRSAKMSAALLPATEVYDSNDHIEGKIGAGYNYVAKALVEAVRDNGVLAHDSRMIVEDVVNNVSTIR